MRSSELSNRLILKGETNKVHATQSHMDNTVKTRRPSIDRPLTLGGKTAET